MCCDSKGLAIATVVKAAFIFSARRPGRCGRRTGVAGWSIITPQVVGGSSVGAQGPISIILNGDRAVNAFSRGGNVAIGADVARQQVSRSQRGGAIAPTAAVYTYSRSKGLFAGVSLEGAVIGTQRDSNFRYYGRPVRADEILSGVTAPPPGAAPLRSALGR
jgi:lipid-binding SYLF domain-containing protein